MIPGPVAIVEVLEDLSGDPDGFELSLAGAVLAGISVAQESTPSTLHGNVVQVLEAIRACATACGDDEEALHVEAALNAIHRLEVA